MSNFPLFSISFVFEAFLEYFTLPELWKMASINKTLHPYFRKAYYNIMKKSKAIINERYYRTLGRLMQSKAIYANIDGGYISRADVFHITWNDFFAFTCSEHKRQKMFLYRIRVDSPKVKTFKNAIKQMRNETETKWIKEAMKSFLTKQHFMTTTPESCSMTLEISSFFSHVFREDERQLNLLATEMEIPDGPVRDYFYEISLASVWNEIQDLG